MAGRPSDYSKLRKSVALLKNKVFTNEAKFDAISFLPSHILVNILSYCIEGFRKYLCVNPSWYISISNSFDEHFNKMENMFINKYSNIFSFKDSYTCSSQLCFNSKFGIRIDRVLVCENICLQNDVTIRISYLYKYVNNKKQYFRSEFAFDSAKKQSKRSTWIYKNDCEVFLLVSF